jgi:hypothetical protein
MMKHELGGLLKTSNKVPQARKKGILDPPTYRTIAMHAKFKK